MQNKIADVILDCPMCGYCITQLEFKLAVSNFDCPRCGKVKLSSFNTKRFIKKRKTELKVIQGSKNE